MFVVIDKPSPVDESAVYMDEAQRAYFKGLLQRMHSETLTRIHNADLTEREEMADPLDRAAQEQDRDAEARGFERNLKQIRDIELALRRIESEEYGYCLDSGEPIGIARLLANPTALYTVESLQMRETQTRLLGRY